MDAVEAVMQARKLLDTVTPLHRDCGVLCGAACCQADEDGQGGMLLFPGEEALYANAPAFSLTRDDSVLPGLTLLTCIGTCKRSERPLACRIFPLLPLLQRHDDREVLRIVLDPRAFAVCPLCESGLRSLSPAFVDAVRTCAHLLCRVPAHRTFLRAVSEYCERMRRWEEV